MNLKYHSAAMYRRKQLNPQRTKRPVKVGKKKRKIVDIDEECLPVWVRPAGNLPIHPEIDKQLAKPFLSSVYIDPLHGFRFPCGEGVQDAIMEGLHKRMRNRYFRGHKLPAIRRVTEGMLRLPSSKADGSRADDVLEECIRTGQAPPPPGKRGCSEYATAVWNWWREHHHRPVLAQLPVILPKFNVATAGDYFTIHTCPYTKRETLWLWELKTGWPVIPREPDIMSPPLAAIWLTPENRYHLQVRVCVCQRALL